MKRYIHYSGNIEFDNIFRILHINRESFDPDSVRAWLVGNGWTCKVADEARKITKDVLDGKMIKKRDYFLFKDDIINEWHKKAKDSS